MRVYDSGNRSVVVNILSIEIVRALTTSLCSGQFKGVGSANPTIGEAGRLEKVEEHRVEVLVRDEGTSEQIRGAVSELKKVRRIPVTPRISL